MQQTTSSEKQASKKSYQTPELTIHGSVEQLTETAVPIGGSILKFRQPK